MPQRMDPAQKGVYTSLYLVEWGLISIDWVARDTQSLATQSGCW